MSEYSKKWNKLVNVDLKYLIDCLNRNKISINVKKTGMVISKSKQKKFEDDYKETTCLPTVNVTSCDLS